MAKNRLRVFGNELKKLTSDVEKVTLGNLIKDSFIATEGKNIRASNHANLARVGITTNSEEFNITTTDSPRGEPERALFYVRSHNNLSLGVSQSEYETRRDLLRPFFEQFYKLMETEEDMDHLMWFFSQFEFDRNELFDMSSSSFNDPDVLKHNLVSDQRASSPPVPKQLRRLGGLQFFERCSMGVADDRHQYSHCSRLQQGDSRYMVKANDVTERMIELGLVGASRTALRTYRRIRHGA